MSAPSEVVEVFTDGGCWPNPGGPGGAGAILRWKDSRGVWREREVMAGEYRTTNNRMEIAAVIVGLQSLKKPCTVTVYSDSQYVVDSVNKWLAGWARKDFTRGSAAKPEPLRNEDLWRQLHGLTELHQVSARWVRGHNGHPLNERADRLAFKAKSELVAGRLEPLDVPPAPERAQQQALFAL